MNDDSSKTKKFIKIQIKNLEIIAKGFEEMSNTMREARERARREHPKLFD